MTWTIFEYNTGSNETGGKKYAIIPIPKEDAIEWWADEYDTDPERYSNWPETKSQRCWKIEDYDDPKTLRDNLGTVEESAGGIGSTLERSRTWKEIYQSDDIRVVSSKEVTQ